MHYGTKAYSDVLPADEFLEDQKKGSVKEMETNEMTVDPKVKPAEPMIVLLNWRSGK